jgi:hypothetical protein
MEGKKFIRVLKMELKKATHNKMFVGTFIVSCFFAVMAALYQIGSYEDLIQSSLLQKGAKRENTLYNNWMGVRRSSIGAICFFYLLPLLAAFPYGWGYLSEKKNGYVKSLISKCGKKTYYGSKYIATFVAGGVVIFVPLLINFVMVACFIPAYLPNIHYFPYYGIMQGDIWGNLFYSVPLLYVILYTVLDFIFAGLFACMSLACSMFIENRIAVLLTPYFLVLLLHYARSLNYYRFYYEISPLNFLGAQPTENTSSWIIILLEGCIFFFITLGMVAVAGRKKELL